MAAATGLPQVSSARKAPFSFQPASNAFCRSPPPDRTPPAMSPRSAPAQKPEALPEVMTAPLMDSSVLMRSTSSGISFITEEVRVFIERPGTSKAMTAMPSASMSILKFSIVIRSGSDAFDDGGMGTADAQGDQGRRLVRAFQLVQG